MFKRGELTSSQIITLVLVIAGLAFLLGFLYLVFGGSGQTVSRETCKLSVLTRATAPDEISAQIPLNCETEKICFTDKLFGGNCKQFVGEEGVRVERISSDPDKAAKTISEIAANAMYDCWSMLGEGKIDIFGKAWSKFGLGDSGSPTCIVCSRLAISEDVENIDEITKRIDVDKYISENNVPGKEITYLESFTDKNFRVSADTEIDFKQVDNLDGSPKTISGGSDNQIAFVFSQVKTKKWQDVLANEAGLVVGTSFFVPGKLAIAKALYLGPQAILTVPITVGLAVLPPLNAYNGRLAAAGYCGKFSSSDEDYFEGCSLIQGVDYNVQDINSLCPSSIQGKP